MISKNKNKTKHRKQEQTKQSTESKNKQNTANKTNRKKRYVLHNSYVSFYEIYGRESRMENPEKLATL